MSNSKKRMENTKKLVLGAIFTALVIAVQSLAQFTSFFGPFSTAIALVPIVLGTAMCGVITGGWLGFVFGVTVLITGGATFFMGFSVPGAIITTLIKGLLCGLVAGVTYKLISKWNRYIAVMTASLVCPIVNTATFLLGCAVFFLEYAQAIAQKAGIEADGMEVFIVIAMGNFIFEIIINLVLSPVIFKVLNVVKN